MNVIQKYMITGLVTITVGNVDFACDPYSIAEAREELAKPAARRNRFDFGYYPITKTQQKDKNGTPYTVIRADTDGAFIECEKESDKFFAECKCELVKINPWLVNDYFYAPGIDDSKCKLPSNFYRLLNKTWKKQ